jgi:membrane associated rhomboid family serine protease
MFPNMRLMLLFPPIPIKAKYLALGILAIDLFSGVARTNSGIGHFAHVAGALVGFLLIVYWGKLNLR